MPASVAASATASSRNFNCVSPMRIRRRLEDVFGDALLVDEGADGALVIGEDGRPTSTLMVQWVAANPEVVELGGRGTAAANRQNLSGGENEGAALVRPLDYHEAASSSLPSAAVSRLAHFSAPALPGRAAFYSLSPAFRGRGVGGEGGYLPRQKLPPSATPLPPSGERGVLVFSKRQ